MITVRFPEFEAYTSSLRDIDVRVLLPKLITPHWQISNVSIGDIQLQYGSEGSGAIADGAVQRGGRMCFVPFAGRYRGNGRLMDKESVLVGDPGAEFSISVAEAHEWCTLFLPYESTAPNANQDAEFLKQPHSQLVRPGAATMHRMRELLQSLLTSIRIDSTVLSAELALTNLRAELMTACQPIVAPLQAVMPSTGRPRVSRPDVVRAIRKSLDQFPDAWPSLRELADSANVSERTIRNIFRDQYGVSPRRYLWLHRMHQVRAALRSSERGCTTVTATAARFGFWHFGRFAAQYRRLFGERPSETLSCSTKS